MMTRLMLSLLTSAALFAPLAARVGAYPPAKPVQIALGEPSAAVHKALDQFDVLSQYGGPPNSPTESYHASGLDIHFLRGTVETITIRHTSPPMGLASAQKARQAIVSVKRIGAGDAVQVSLGETAEAVRQSLGEPDSSVVIGLAGSQSGTYFTEGLFVQYLQNKVDTLTVKHYRWTGQWARRLPDKFKQAVVLVPGS